MARTLSRLLRLLALSGLIMLPGARVEAQGTEPTVAPSPEPDRPLEGEPDRPVEGWGVAPAGPDGEAQRSAFAYVVQPGQVLRDSVVITNLSDETLHVDLYGRDAFNTSEDAAFALQAVDEEPQHAGSWVTLGFDEVEVPPETARVVNFELSVPDDASPGDHTAGIIAENREVLASVDESGMPVDIRQRVAARVYVRVDGPLEPRLQVTELSIGSTRPLLPFAQGSTTIDYEVANVGNTRVVAAAELDVKGLFGRTVHSFPPEDLPELLPGGSVRITRTFDGVPPVERLVADLDLTAIDGSTEESASSSTFAWAWATWILLLLITAILIGLLLRRRGSRDGSEAGGKPASDPEPDGDVDGEPASDPEPDEVGVGVAADGAEGDP